MSQMGFLGALGGAGKGTAEIGETLLKDSLSRRQEQEDDERRMRIEEFRIGAARAEGDRQYARDRAASTADAETAHKYRMKEIGAASQSKAAAGGGSSMGGWKADDLEKEARTLAAKGMGLDSDSLTTMDDATAKKFAATTSAIVQEFRKRPDDGVAAAYDRVINPQKPVAAAPKVGDTREVNGKTYQWTENGPVEVTAKPPAQQPTQAQKAQPKKADPMVELNDIRRLSGARNLGPGLAAGLAERLKTIWNDLGPTNTEKFELLDKLNRLAKAKS